MSILIKGIHLPEAYGSATLTVYECVEGRAIPREYKITADQMREIPPHGPLIDGQALYDRTAEWEAEAFDQLEKSDPQAEKQGRGWKFWNTVLTERTGFKHDVMDAPVIIEAEEAP